jgi:hypothetical protein
MKIWLNAKQRQPNTEGLYLVGNIYDSTELWVAYWDDESWVYPEGHDEEKHPITHWANVGGPIVLPGGYSNIIDDQQAQP